MTTDGITTDGLATGGLATGGPATGGPATGGLATGGLATSGPATGGLATGGLATGGPAVGGLAAGLAAAWQAGCGLVWPIRCAGCGRPDVAVCGACRAAVAGPGFNAPLAGWPPGWGAWAAAGYRGVPARLLIAWKERGRHDVGGPLGVGLAAAIRACREDVRDVTACDPAPPWLLVPVPSTPAARRRRGSDLGLELARAAAAECWPGWRGPPPRPAGVLRHVRRVRDQADLGASARRSNLAGALAVRSGWAERLAGRSCVVVDDIVTTGATAAEAARALTDVGARVVGICCLSVTFSGHGVSGGGPLH